MSSDLASTVDRSIDVLHALECSKGSSLVLTYPHVDVGALNDGVGTLISVNDAASTVDGTLTSDAGSLTIGKPFTNNLDCTGTVTYNPDCATTDL